MPEMKPIVAILGFVLLVGLTPNLSAQVDSIFWFAVPNFSEGHGDIPIYFRFTSLDKDVSVIISQPANPAFQDIHFDMSANSAHSVEVSSIKAQIENDQADLISTKGIHIRSTGLINAYYENASRFNPEIFSLKGQKALGKQFMIPMQDFFPNGNYNPTPYASFDIVATEDQTEVTVVPAHDIVGHQARDTVRLMLNKGETYVARARSTVGNQHLGGSLVLSDKPVAVTLKDDSMASSSIYGRCADLGGDQITPVDYLGREYISIPGALNGPNDAVFIYAIKDSTQVTINGIDRGWINRSERIQEFSRGLPMHILASQDVYVLHMSGFGCEVGLDQLPPVNPCNGSRILAVNRSSDQPFFLNILVYEGLKEHFTFNGDPNIIQSTHFQPVPGLPNQWHYARVEISLQQMAVGQAAIIQNLKGPFHLSVIHGGPGTGTMYGYFSGYGEVDILPELEVTCSDTLRLELDQDYAKYQWSTGDTTAILSVLNSGYYSVTITDHNGCVASDTLYAELRTAGRSEEDHVLCPGDSINIHGEWFGPNRTEGEIVLPGASENGCDSILEVRIKHYPVADTTITLIFCQQDTIPFHGLEFHVGHTQDTLLLPSSAKHGCDSIIFVRSKVLHPTMAVQEPWVCIEEEAVIAGETFNLSRPSGKVILTGENAVGCDSIIDVQLHFYERDTGSLTLSACKGDTAWYEGAPLWEEGRSQVFLLEGQAQNGCDSFVNVQLNSYPRASSVVRPSVCYEDTLDWLGKKWHRAYTSDSVILEGASHFGCDSVIHVDLKVLPQPKTILRDTLCPWQSRTIGGELFTFENQKGFLTLDKASHHGCDSLIDVDIYFPTNAIDIQDTFHLGYGQSIELQPWYQRTFDQWAWHPEDYLTCADCERPVASPPETQVYQLRATDPYGCEYQTKTQILIFRNKKVFIPNAITVNDDRLNDGFTLFGNYFVERIELLEIYSRWGELLFRTEDIPKDQPDLGWDGHLNGRPVQPGVYTYLIRARYLDGKTDMFTGDVTVIR
jgi:gliding motility-associated-like protein